MEDLSTTKKQIQELNLSIDILTDQNYQQNKELIDNFDTGNPSDNKMFDHFIQKEALDNSAIGNGVTYLVFNEVNDTKELVAYFTLVTGAILYTDQADDCDDSDITCAVPSVQITMFAVCSAYQDCFIATEDRCYLVAAIIFQNIVDLIKSLRSNVIGLNSIFLHSVPSAVSFYENCNFEPLRDDMFCYYDPDGDETETMYMPFKKIPYNYKPLPETS